MKRTKDSTFRKKPGNLGQQKLGSFVFLVLGVLVTWISLPQFLFFFWGGFNPFLFLNLNIMWGNEKKKKKKNENLINIVDM